MNNIGILQSLYDDATKSTFLLMMNAVIIVIRWLLVIIEGIECTLFRTYL